MNKEFKILTREEEQKLTKQELKKYYIELREYLAARPFTNVTPKTVTIAPKLKGITDDVTTMITNSLRNKNIELKCDGIENIPSERVIFAYLSQEPLDKFIWLSQINRHCFVYGSQEANKLLSLFQHSIGLIPEKNKYEFNPANAKLDMIRLLLEGNSIVYFVASLNNLSPDQLHFHTNYEFLDIAKKAGVPIIPVIHEYTYKNLSWEKVITKIHSMYGEPMYVSEEDNLYKKIEEYEEIVSNMQLELAEAEKIRKRRVLNKQYNI